MRPLCVSFYCDELEQLRTIAEDLGMSMAALIRQVLKRPSTQRYTANRSGEDYMNMTDVGRPKVTLHPSEAQRLLSWMKCYPVGSEKERRSLESVLAMAIELSNHAK